MKSSTTAEFWTAFAALPEGIKARAKLAYQLWLLNPRHPSCQFKKVGDVWSVRVGGGYRALAVLEGDTFVWFWIGTHDQYERLLRVRQPET